MRSESPVDFKLEKFEGPLDLLMMLIRNNDINIYDIPIAEITEQFIAFIEQGEHINLDNLTEFYAMAASLIYIKSKMLLPVEVDLDEEFEDPRRELVEKLIEYQKFRKITDMMQEQIGGEEWFVDRRRRQKTLPFPEANEDWEEMDVLDLCRIFSGLLKKVPFNVNIYEDVTVEEKETLIDEYLQTKKEFLFTDLIKNYDSAMEVICAFLSILIYVRDHKISLMQNKMFGDIKITAYKKTDSDSVKGGDDGGNGD